MGQALVLCRNNDDIVKIAGNTWTKDAQTEKAGKK